MITTQTQTAVSLKEVQEVAQHIVARFCPQKVILFGSYAYGQPHEGSDVDLLVVISHPPSRQEAWNAKREIRQHCRFPVQVGFMSPEEFDETKHVVGGLAYSAHHWGRILHEANA